ncbi:MAG: hypothetical protein ACOVOR_00110 [Rhabdochlamydiaceae bacterium]
MDEQFHFDQLIPLVDNSVSSHSPKKYIHKWPFKRFYDFSEQLDISPLNQLDFSHLHKDYQEGLCLYEEFLFCHNPISLSEASKKLRLVFSTKPDYEDVAFTLGCVLLDIASQYHQSAILCEAIEKLEVAKINYKSSKLTKMPTILWKQAICYLRLADESKEPSDRQKAVNLLMESSRFFKDDNFPYWEDLVKAYLKLAQQTQKTDFCYEALSVLGKQPLNSTTWNYRGMALALLFELTEEEDLALQADECFMNGQKNRFDFLVQKKWAYLLLQLGAITKKEKYVEAAIEKFSKLSLQNPENQQLLSSTGEAMALKGLILNDLKLIREGENLCASMAEKQTKNPLAWLSWGISLSHLGLYFNEIDYHFQAIEKFQQGLSLNRKEHVLWHKMAVAYTNLAIKLEDLDLFSKGVKFHEKAIFLHPISRYQIDYAFCLSHLGLFSKDKKILERAIVYFERGFNKKKNIILYETSPLFQYALTIDGIGEFYEEESIYRKAVDILLEIFEMDPDFPHLKYQIALVHSHLADVTACEEDFYKSIHYYKLALKKSEENDQILVDYGVVLISLSQVLNEEKSSSLLMEAEHKLSLAVKLGNLQALYYLACLYAILKNEHKSLWFLKKSHSYQSLPEIEDLIEDEWLENIKDAPSFNLFLRDIKNQ